MRVLVIDDDPSLLRLIEKTLVSAGHDPVLIVDPSEVDQVEGAVEACIFDWHLGDQTCEQLVEHTKARFPDAPFMIITGDTDLDLIQRALDLGAVGWWFKATGPENLQRQLAELYRRVDYRAAG